MRIVRIAVALACTWAALAAQAAAVEYKIVTASERGTYIQIGRDLARFVAPEADIALEALPSAGSSENVMRLRSEPGVKLALVQSDVYQAFLDKATAGNPQAAETIRPLRVVMPLYNEEIYFITRADSPLQSVHEIRDARINVGPLLSGTALSATTLYKQMFGKPLPDGQASYLSNEDALVKLTVDKSIDVVVAVAGQPAKLLVDMKPEARQLIRLLKFDASHPASKAALQTYFPSVIKASNYPNLLPEDVPGVAVKAFLVTYNFAPSATSSFYLNRFARSLCRNFPTLQAEGHPKWKEVTLALPPLGKGWSYYAPMAREMSACMGEQQQAAAPRPVTPVNAQCAQQDRILGLCK
ncbi:TAXI family TRAP transporter solute-binding subunit [Azohydromonas aeria]|uniref:TAXI family TRAP transporter solute-binding subunit n=1 Tax=Azohydromonas aeria TaxID=2590212 RepID=UPI0012F86F79|nr:TAXI family TRAP transporter solute-binding subunit [Azohydromonas aeria]